MKLEIQTVLSPSGATMGIILGTKPLHMPLVILEPDPPLWPCFNLQQYHPSLQQYYLTVVVICRCHCPVSDVFSLLTCLIVVVLVVVPASARVHIGKKYNEKKRRRGIRTEESVTDDD